MATVAAGVLAAGAFTLVSSAGASPSGATTMGMHGVHAAAGHVGYGFRTLDDAADPTFNQLLGINDHGLIAGYFGSGAQGHPNMGYLLNGTSYASENVPGSVQTQVTGLNDNDVAVGFYVDKGGNNHGYEYNIASHGYSRVLDPADPGASLTAAAINDHGDVAGFYAGTGGKTVAFLKTAGGQFRTLAYPGARPPARSA